MVSKVNPENVIGELGKREPRVCAVSGQRMRKPYITYHLNGGYIYRVLAKRQASWSKELHDQIKALVPTKPVSKVKDEVKS